MDCWNLWNIGVFFENPKLQSWLLPALFLYCVVVRGVEVVLSAQTNHILFFIFLFLLLFFALYFLNKLFLCTSANWKDQMLFDRRSSYRLNDNFFVHVHQYLCETSRRPFKLSSTCIHFPWLLSCCCQTYLFHIPFCPCLLWKGVFQTKQQQKEVKDQRLWYSI